ncbi:MAG: heavy metal translocating P-type ATPase, partial [Bacteroidia bacterium]|nr:heavy metal translocating P-type ATPase [Bacteroidia bacterium]
SVFSALIIYLHMFTSPSEVSHGLQFLFSIPVVFYAGQKIYVNAFKQLLLFSISMDTLIALGTGVAFLFSTFQLFFNPLQDVVLYYESSTAIIALVLLGKWIEENALNKENHVYDALVAIRQLRCRVWKNDKWQEVESLQIQKGDKVLVLAQERIPVDGVIVEGNSYVDESIISGESIPVSKNVNDTVISGSINITNELIIEASTEGQQSILQKIIEQIQYAQSTKVRLQRLVDTIVQYFVPVLLGLALLVFGGWYIWRGDLFFAFERALTVLVASCPCALGLAAPLVIKTAISKALQKGALIKDSTLLEQLSKTNVICFDKTGTLTTGKPTILRKNIFTDKEDYLVELAKYSQHPLAKAIYREYEKNLIPERKILYQEIPGKGIIGKIEKYEVILGKPEFLIEKGYCNAYSMDWDSSYTVVAGGIDGEIVALWEFADSIHPLAQETVTTLKNVNPSIQIFLLTGDKKNVAYQVSKELGIPFENVKYSLLPAEKSEFIQSLKKRGNIVAFIGDGYNDGIALSEANFGIAVAGGTDLALQVASVTLMNNNLMLVPRLFGLSQTVRKLIRQNLFIAFGYNLSTLPLAIGLIQNWELSPILAGLAMTINTVAVGLNSLRIKF